MSFEPHDALNGGSLPANNRRWEQIYKGCTYNKAVVALRFDDGYSYDTATLAPLLAARDLVAGFAIVNTNIGGSGKMTLAQILALQNKGHELMGHSRTHGTTVPGTLAEFTDETVTAAAELVAQNMFIQAFVQPGTWTNTAYQMTSEALVDSQPGALLQNSFAGFEGYLPEFSRGAIPTDVIGVLPLPARNVYGGNHVSIVTTLASLQSLIDRAVIFGGLVEILFHGNLFDGGSYMTTAELTTFLTYIQTKRDAGLLDVMTPTAARHAVYSATKNNLLADPTFNNSATGNFVFWSTTGSPTVLVGGGQSGGNAVQVGSGKWVQQNVVTGSKTYFDEIRSVRFEGYAKRATPGLASVARVIVRFRDGSTNWTDQQLSADPGDTFTKITVSAGNDPRATSGFEVWAYWTSGGDIVWSDLQVYKV